MPVVLAVVAIVALVGGGIFFFSNNTPPVTANPQEEAITRTEVEDTNESTPEPDNTEVVAEQEIAVESEPTPEPDNTEVVAEQEIAVESEPVESVTTATQYSASASYLTPARTSHDILVDLTVDSAGVVTATEITYDGGSGFSNAHQERFDQAVASEVNGKQLSEISLSRVGGASLTSEAFNEAVAKIEAQQA